MIDPRAMEIILELASHMNKAEIAMLEMARDANVAGHEATESHYRSKREGVGLCRDYLRDTIKRLEDS